MTYQPHPPVSFRLSCVTTPPTLPSNTLHWIGVYSDMSYVSPPHESHLTMVQDIAKQRRLNDGEAIFVGANIVLQGVGKPTTAPEWHLVGARARRAALGERVLVMHLESLDEEAVLNVAYGAELSSWEFRRYRTNVKPIQPACREVVLISPHADQPGFQQKRSRDQAIIASIHWARDMANRPGNDINPTTFAQAIQAIPDLKTFCVPDSELRAWGALQGVAQGSQQPPCVAVAQWNGTNDPTTPPSVILVGKGVTFDSGGLSIKPSSGMEEMKLDKTGAVVVCAVVKALAAMKANVHVVAVTPLVENMPSGTAQRPGDIVTSLSGQTIEVLNTDAEGRLILADALTYVQNTWPSAAVVDVATLTGAVRVALGPVFAGLFTRHKPLQDELQSIGEETGERLWPLPLHPDYDKALDTPCADMKNITRSGYGAGSSTAAQFLARFVRPETLWAHVDIAGVDVAHAATPLCPQGGSAFGVALLVHWILRHHQAATS